jgi:isocitrate dehydrogenase
MNSIKEQYPYGYSDEDMIVFRNARKEIIKAIEVTHDDTDYLVKVSKRLALHLDNLNDDIEEIDLADNLLTELD